MKRQNLRTVSLIVVTLTYLLIGAAIFGYLESEHEVRQRETLELIELIVKRKYNISEDDFTVLTTTVIKSVPHKAGIQWKFPGAFYFATTVVTTIGYGHSTPATFAGRVFCMFYALIGIPLGLVMFQSIGERLNTFVGSALKYAKRCFRAQNPEVTQTNLVMVVSVLSTILMTSMAAVFAKYERWDYFDALYYCFITLTTIGFGDYVALQKDSALQSKPEYVALSLIFILFGLSVVSSAVNLLVLKFLTLNTEDERRDEHLRHVAARGPHLEGDVIVTKPRPPNAGSNLTESPNSPPDSFAGENELVLRPRTQLISTKSGPRKRRQPPPDSDDAQYAVAQFGSIAPVTRPSSLYNHHCGHHHGYRDSNNNNGESDDEEDGDDEDEDGEGVAGTCHQHNSCLSSPVRRRQDLQRTSMSQTMIEAEPNKQTSNKGFHQHNHNRHLQHQHQHPFIISPVTFHPQPQHHHHKPSSHHRKPRTSNQPQNSPPDSQLSPRRLVFNNSPVRQGLNVNQSSEKHLNDIQSIDVQVGHPHIHCHNFYGSPSMEPMSLASSCSCSFPSMDVSVDDSKHLLPTLTCSQCQLEQMLEAKGLFQYLNQSARSHNHLGQHHPHHHSHQAHRKHSRRQNAHCSQHNCHQDDSNRLGSSRTLTSLWIQPSGGPRFESSAKHDLVRTVARTSSARVLNRSRYQAARSSSSTSLTNSQQEAKATVAVICKNCCQHLECIEHAIRARTQSAEVKDEQTAGEDHLDQERQISDCGGPNVTINDSETAIKTPAVDIGLAQTAGEPTNVEIEDETFPVSRATNSDEAERIFGETRF